MGSSNDVNRRFFIKTLGSTGAFYLLSPAGRGGDGPPSRPTDGVSPKAAPPESGADPRRSTASSGLIRSAFDEIDHEADFCVVGGGMAGLCAAVAAARHGARVVLLQDRPVLGGNASSEIRMHICGAHGEENRETGILEEIFMENCHRNPGLKYPIWDTVLYEKARFQDNLKLLLNCTCNDVLSSEGRIESVRGWQLTSQTWHHVKARYFADCSGDSILRICGAEFRRGREARDEFDESHAPPVADEKTMGNSILIQLRATDDHVPFVPPRWAHKYADGDLPQRNLKPSGNFWWLEIGGEQDTIADAEAIRDELYKIAFGVWDYIKNHRDGRGARWELEWIGALPGKRENIRYVGDHILTQNDVEGGGKFEDIVAYGGWSMDDHHPAAIEHKGAPTIFHPAPSPYGIPYRVLYSRNVENLFFAGRNISATHMAMSSTRVMATCAILGQAVGTAAALAAANGLTPRGVYEKKMEVLQKSLMDDDCYLPGKRCGVSRLSREAALSASEGDPEPLRNGADRTLDKIDNGWWGKPDAWVEYRFIDLQQLSRARFVFDSHLPFDKRMPSSDPGKGNKAPFPRRMCRDFDLLVLANDGTWTRAVEVKDNYQRLMKVPLRVETRAIRFVPRRSWGWDQVHLFAFEVS